jgi:hypothetical protein
MEGPGRILQRACSVLGFVLLRVYVWKYAAGGRENGGFGIRVSIGRGSGIGVVRAVYFALP